MRQARLSLSGAASLTLRWSRHGISTAAVIVELVIVETKRSSCELQEGQSVAAPDFPIPHPAISRGSSKEGKGQLVRQDILVLLWLFKPGRTTHTVSPMSHLGPCDCS